MINAILIDDDANFRSNFRSQLENSCKNITLLTEAESVKKGIQLIKNQKPELVFLDVEMGAETGFDLLGSFPKIDFRIIFVTSYSKYAERAFKFCAVDFLRKPFKNKDLITAVNKVEDSIKEKASIKLLENLRIYLDSPHESELVLEEAKEKTYLKLEDIISIERIPLSNYTEFILQRNAKEISGKSLSFYNAILNQFRFVRINYSCIINVNHQKKYFSSKEAYVIMSNNKRYDVSRRRKKDLEDQL